MRFLASVILNAIALWVTVTVLHGGLHVSAYREGTWPLIHTYLALSAVYGLVNAVIGKVVRTLSIPLYCLTLGLFALVVNGFLFWIVAWLSGEAGFGLTIENFWWAIGGALLMGLCSAVLNGLFTFGRGSRRERARE